MSYEKKRQAACEKLFEGFYPDTSRSKKPDQVIAAYEGARIGKTTAQIAEELGVTPKTIQKIYRRYNFPNLQNFFPPRMEERKGWNGGIKECKGYLYKRTLDHPNGSKYGNYVAVHRLVLEKKLGRYLLPTEVVDHIDGNPKNNHPDNLRVFSSNAEHLRKTITGKPHNVSPENRAKLSRLMKERRRQQKGLSA